MLRLPQTGLPRRGQIRLWGHSASPWAASHVCQLVCCLRGRGVLPSICLGRCCRLLGGPGLCAALIPAIPLEGVGLATVQALAPPGLLWRIRHLQLDWATLVAQLRVLMGVVLCAIVGVAQMVSLLFCHRLGVILARHCRHKHSMSWPLDTCM